MIIYKEVRSIKNEYKQQIDERRTKIDTLNKEKK